MRFKEILPHAVGALLVLGAAGIALLPQAWFVSSVGVAVAILLGIVLSSAFTSGVTSAAEGLYRARRSFITDPRTARSWDRWGNIIGLVVLVGIVFAVALERIRLQSRLPEMTEVPRIQKVPLPAEVRDDATRPHFAN